MIARGRLYGRHSDLDEPLDQLDGEVEVTVRPAGEVHPTVADYARVDRTTFPPGTRTKEGTDQQIAEERASWDRGQRRTPLGWMTAADRGQRVPSQPTIGRSSRALRGLHDDLFVHPARRQTSS